MAHGFEQPRRGAGRRQAVEKLCQTRLDQGCRLRQPLAEGHVSTISIGGGSPSAASRGIRTSYLAGPVAGVKDKPNGEDGAPVVDQADRADAAHSQAEGAGERRPADSGTPETLGTRA